MNEIRKDYFLDRWVIIASNRGKRPESFKKRSETADKGVCFFCPGNEHMTPPEIDRIEEKGRWIIRCFPNKFPATMPEKGKASRGALTSIPAYGKHEVVVEAPEHDAQLGDLSVDHILKALDMYRRRIDAMFNMAGIKYVTVFKNRGKEAGASISHTHTQIIGLPNVPRLISGESAASRGKCPLCGVWKREIKGERRIFEDECTVAFAPFASRFPLEVWLMPKRHVKSINEMNPEEKKSFASTLKHVLTKLNLKLDYPPYNFYLHVSPRGEDLHFHLELCPKLSIMAGFELGSDMYINVVTPESAAGFYRD